MLPTHSEIKYLVVLNLYYSFIYYLYYLIILILRVTVNGDTNKKCNNQEIYYFIKHCVLFIFDYINIIKNSFSRFIATEYLLHRYVLSHIQVIITTYHFHRVCYFNFMSPQKSSKQF